MDKVKKISAEQLEQLFEFTRKHYVEYYDLQCELTDHLANAIEERWAVQPGLSFNEALHYEFKKFGIFGFTGIVEKRQLALSKKYNKLIWGYFKEFFTLPKVILTIAMVLVVYRILSLSVIAYSVLMVGALLFSLAKLISMWVKFKKHVKQTGRKWLLEELIMKCGGAGGIVYLPYHLLFRIYSNEPSQFMMWFMSVVLVAFCLCLYVMLYVIPSKAQEHLLKTYPEYNM